MVRQQILGFTASIPFSAGLKSLKRLSLGFNNITDECLVNLKGYIHSLLFAIRVTVFSTFCLLPYVEKILDMCNPFIYNLFFLIFIIGLYAPILLNEKIKREK